MAEDFHLSLGAPYFKYSFALLTTNVLVRMYDIAIIFGGLERHERVVVQRFEDHEEHYFDALKISICASLAIIVLSTVNCFLIKRFLQWRKYVPVLNGLVLWFIIPPFSIYDNGEVVAMLILQHIMQILISTECTEFLWQIIVLCIMQMISNFINLYQYMPDGEYLTDCIIFTVFNFGFCIIIGRSNQKNRRQSFFDHQANKSMINEFNDIMNHFPEGTMIAKVEEKEAMKVPTVQLLQDLSTFMDTIREKMQVQQYFKNKAMD